MSQTSTITTKHISNTTAFDTLKRDTGFDVSNSSDIVQSDSFVRGSKDGHLSIREGAINTVTSLDTTRNVAAEDQPYTICSNYEVKIPFPPRPKILVTASNESAEHVQYPAPSSSDAATRKGDESTPRSALCIPNRTKDGRQCVTYLPADFYPWNGTHPEDILSESAIRAGMYDRLLPNEAQQQLQRETSSARNLLRPPLKNKYGLHALSSFIANVLERRQARSCVMSSVMLRPPPRVTLTDTKREAWLRDLADPARDIRKLSRSIPHGLKGKSLLEQCMSKKIPVLRAVWFAKCVGANEIRAFNRKGSGAAMSVDGEVKWVRDWTLQLQQFIESIITPCKREDWWKNINYVWVYNLTIYILVY